jgi:hypothetical protein
MSFGLQHVMAIAWDRDEARLSPGWRRCFVMVTEAVAGGRGELSGSDTIAIVAGGGLG